MSPANFYLVLIKVSSLRFYEMIYKTRLGKLITNNLSFLQCQN